MTRKLIAPMLALALVGCAGTGERIDSDVAAIGGSMALRALVAAYSVDDPEFAGAVVSVSTELLARLDAGEPLYAEALQAELRTRLADADMAAPQAAALLEVLRGASELIATTRTEQREGVLRRVLTGARMAALPYQEGV